MIVEFTVQRTIAWPNENRREKLQKIHQKSTDEKNIAEKELHEKKSLELCPKPMPFFHRSWHLKKRIEARLPVDEKKVSFSSLSLTLLSFFSWKSLKLWRRRRMFNQAHRHQRSREMMSSEEKKRKRSRWIPPEIHWKMRLNRRFSHPWTNRGERVAIYSIFNNQSMFFSSTCCALSFEHIFILFRSDRRTERKRHRSTSIRSFVRSFDWSGSNVPNLVSLEQFNSCSRDICSSNRNLSFRWKMIFQFDWIN